jgi:hypothetical protein
MEKVAMRLKTVCVASMAVLAGMVVGAIAELPVPARAGRKVDAARSAKAAELVKRAREAIGNDRSSFLDYAFFDVAQAEAALGNVAGAKGAVSMVEDPENQIKAMLLVARSQADHGDLYGAKQTLAAAIKQVSAPATRATSMPATAPGKNPSVLVEVGTAQAHLGEIGAARKTADKIRGTWQAGEILAAIGEWQAGHGDLKAARQNFAEARKELRASEDQYPMFRDGDLVDLQIKAGDLAGASETIEAIPEKAQRVGPLVELGAQQARAGDKQGGKATLEKARQILDADTAGGEEWQKAGVTLSMADALSAVGDAEGAARTRAEAAKLIQNIPQDNWWRAVLFTKMTLAGVKPGSAEAAAGLEKIKAELMKLPLERGTRVHTIWLAASTCAREGDGSAARSLISFANEQGKIDRIETAFSAASIAGALARAEGAATDTAWIEKLSSSEEKAAAYASAAAALTSVEVSEGK